MVQVEGTELPELMDEADEFGDLINREMESVLTSAIDNIGHVVVAQGSASAASPDDLNPILSNWRSRVATALIPFISRMIRTSSRSQISALFAAMGLTVPRFDEDVITRMIIQGAENRLAGIGDILWGNARDALVTALERGESIGNMSQRIRDTLSVSQRRAERISRTEVIGASNKSSIEVIRATGFVSQKRWIATFDDRVRISHIDADGQMVSINDAFMVGIDLLDHPGDFNGSPEEIINCRCAMGYEVNEDSPSNDAMTAAAEYANLGMIALIPRNSDVKHLALDGGELKEDIHLTIAFLGDESEWSDEQRTSLFDLFNRDSLSNMEPATGFAFGAAHWNPESDSPAWVLNVGGKDIEKMHKIIWETLTQNEDDNEFPYPEQHRPWASHVTLLYSKNTGVINDIESRLGEIVFDHIRVNLGNDTLDIPLHGTVNQEENTMEVHMPWFVEEGHDCPNERPWAVVKESDGSIEGCHETQADAESQIRALEAAEDEDRDDVEEMSSRYKSFQEDDEREDEDDGCPPGEHRMPDGECMPDEEMVEFEGIAVVEGAWTGDGRQFAQGSLDWPNLNEVTVPFQWQKETSHGGLNDVTVSVGRLTVLERSGNKILVQGYIDDGSADGQEVIRRLENHTLGGVSIVADDPEQAAVEFVWPDDNDAEDEDIMAMPKIIFHSGRIRALTLVDTAAFVEASISLKDKSDRQNHDDTMVTSHQYGRMDVKHMYGDITKSITASSEQPSSFDLINELEPLIAASHTITIPDLPPAEWFNEPTELPEFGAITVTDEGRMYGLLAPKNIAHRGYADKKITVPTKTVDYSRWMNRVTIVEDGSRIATGSITMDCGHAPLAGGSTESADHYDNTCSVIATARVGENQHGVWIAGAVLPGVKPEQITRMLACQLSGDWRPHREKPGFRELVAALLVPVPGFPVAASPRVTMDNGALAASTVPVAWYANNDTIVEHITITDEYYIETYDEPDDGDDSSSINEDSSDGNGVVVDELPTWEMIQRRREFRHKADELARSLGIEV